MKTFKSMEYVRQGLVEDLQNGSFLVHHLPRLHKDYIVTGDSCDCQNPNKCSHIHAVQIYVKHRNKLDKYN